MKPNITTTTRVRNHPIARSCLFSAGALLLAHPAAALNVFTENFEGVATGTLLRGAATGSGVFVGPWQNQGDSEGYKIVNNTPLNPGGGNYAIGGSAYTGAARELSEDAAFLIDPDLRYDPDSNPFDGNEAIGGNDRNYIFSASVRKDVAGQAILVSLGTAFFDGGGLNIANTRVGLGDGNGNGFIDIYSGGAVVDSTIPFVLGTTYKISVAIDFDATGTGATLVLTVDGVLTTASLVTTDGTFRELGYYGGNGANRSSVDDIKVDLVEPSSGGFAQFKIDNGLPAETEPDDDFDFDGVSDLVEYALGTLPNDASSAFRPVLSREAGTGQPQLTFPSNALPDLRYTVQASNDLSDWSTILFTSEGAANTSGSVTVTDNINVPNTPKRFLRLKVDLLPEG